MPTLTVDPIIIDPDGYAEISHDGSTTITVTITNQNGVQETVDVPPNTVVKWYPPNGWTEARFNADNCDEVFRFIRKLEEGGEAPA